jgi:hypothetical protein
VSSGPACRAHAAESIRGTCVRCGDFVCRLDSVERDGRLLCLACAARAVEHLERMRLEYWGKRDGFAILFGGVGTVANLLMAAAVGVPAALAGRPGPLAFAALGAAVDGAYYFGVPAARWGVIVLPVVAALGEPRIATPFFLLAFALPVAAFFDTRNRLFFRIEVPERRLAKLYDTLKNNSEARNGFGLALVGLVFPVALVIALPLAIVGLSRVDPYAEPPVGRRKQAIAGIAIAALGIAAWAAVIATAWLR